MPTEQQNKIRVTEYLDLDGERARWFCNRSGHALGAARENHKRGCRRYDREPREIHPALVSGEFNVSPDPLWVRIVEFYCPSCGVQMETEYLPPGHPLTWDIEMDLDSLKERLKTGEYKIRKQRLEVSE